MSQIIYKKFNISIGNRIIDLCEQMKIEYTIWNTEELCCFEGVDMELGLTKKDWLKLPLCYQP